MFCNIVIAEEAEEFNREFEHKTRPTLGAIGYSSSSSNRHVKRHRELPALPPSSTRWVSHCVTLSLWTRWVACQHARVSWAFLKSGDISELLSPATICIFAKVSLDKCFQFSMCIFACSSVLDFVKFLWKWKSGAFNQHGLSRALSKLNKTDFQKKIV